jgi:hypothetical protein
MSIKDILFFALISLTVGLLANHYLNLDIGFLNDIENSLVSSGQSGKSSTRGVGGTGAGGAKSNSAECESLKKFQSERKTIALMELDAAKKQRDITKIRETEAKLEELALKERAVCR